jgi:hypothetical protein
VSAEPYKLADDPDLNNRRDFPPGYGQPLPDPSKVSHCEGVEWSEPAQTWRIHFFIGGKSICQEGYSSARDAETAMDLVKKVVLAFNESIDEDRQELAGRLRSLETQVSEMLNHVRG